LKPSSTYERTGDEDGQNFGAAMMSRGKAERKAAQKARLSAALRENLKRRKAQVRARTGGELDTAGPVNAQSAPQTPDFRRNRGSE